MPPIEVRPFRRSDRDQLVALVNAHIEAVLPGVTVSPNAVLSQLEREPGEYVTDPWVLDRQTVVAVAHDRVVGAAHLLQYASDDTIGPDYRDTGEIRWLIFWPDPGTDATADALIVAGLAALCQRTPRVVYADGTLPTPGVYGIPDRWPHVAAALLRGGFVPGDSVEAVVVAELAQLPAGGPAPIPGLELQIGLGEHGTRVCAVLDGETIGGHEVQGDLTAGGTRSRLDGWADTWQLWVHPQHRRQGIATWLVGHSADRLRLGGARLLLDYAAIAPDDAVEDGMLPFLRHLGFRELTRTRRAWTHER